MQPRPTFEFCVQWCEFAHDTDIVKVLAKEVHILLGLFYVSEHAAVSHQIAMPYEAYIAGLPDMRKPSKQGKSKSAVPLRDLFHLDKYFVLKSYMETRGRPMDGLATEVDSDKAGHPIEAQEDVLLQDQVGQMYQELHAIWAHVNNVQLTVKDFIVKARGGQCTKTQGVAYDTHRGQATTLLAKDWCWRFQYLEVAPFAVKPYSQTIALELGTYLSARANHLLWCSAEKGFE